MTKSELLKLRKDQLLEKIEDYGLQDELDKVRDEDGEVTKSKIADVIMDFIEQQKEEYGEPVVEESKDGKPVDPYTKYGVKHFRDLPKHAKKEILTKDLFRKECVIVFDLKTDQTKMSVMPISWGNNLIGYHTDLVQIDNEVGQYVRRGAIKVLENAKMTVFEQKKNINAGQGQVADVVITKTMPRYRVIRTEGFTEEELRRLVAEQATKKAMEINAV